MPSSAGNALPGLELRKVRGQRGLALEDAARDLGLTVSALRALEADDYAKLPAPVYVRGYIRRYCALLDMQEAGLLERLDELLNPESQSQHEQKAAVFFEKYRWQILTLVAVAVGLVLLAATLWAE